MNALTASLNRRINRRAFDPSTPVRTPHRQYGLVHYGVIVPDLPAPLRFFNLIAILGAARTPAFDNRRLAWTKPADTAWLLLGSAAITDGLRLYSAADDCELASDGSSLCFGDDAVLNTTADGLELFVNRQDVRAQLQIRPTKAATQFSRIPGIFHHWSVLCEYAGSFQLGDRTTDVSGLCTYEYARAVNLKMPVTFFSYHVLNLGPGVQALVVEQRGPGNTSLQRAVYIRHRDGTNEVLCDEFELEVQEFQPPTAPTPHGRRMPLPKRLAWSVRDSSGGPVLSIEGVTNDDFVFGLGVGYAGSYDYSGNFRGTPVTGTAYLEWVDC